MKKSIAKIIEVSFDFFTVEKDFYLTMERNSIKELLLE